VAGSPAIVRLGIESLDQVLKPIGFKRRKQLWNRRVVPFVDTVDIQVSKFRDAFTINVGVMDPDVHRILWGSDRGEFVDEPSCTVRTRIGGLIDRRDKWWKIEDAHAASEASSDVANYVVPFLSRMHSREAMRQWLVDAEVHKKRYPPDIIYLAILEGFLGNSAQSCALLAVLRDKATSEPWRVRIDDVMKQLRCR
jgi:hypothetical protein